MEYNLIEDALLDARHTYAALADGFPPSPATVSLAQKRTEQALSHLQASFADDPNSHIPQGQSA